MKPLGPIPSGYAMIDGELAIGTRTASALVAEAGSTPLFVFSAALIRRRVGELFTALPHSVALHYAVKANPYQLRKILSHANSFNHQEGLKS